PGESVDDWTTTLDRVLALAPSPVSAYALTVEPGTPLGRAVDAGERSAADEDDQALKYEVADDTLPAAGWAWHETSDWAVPRARWHSVDASADGARRAQGRGPPCDRGGACRHRPTGGVADRFALARDEGIERARPQRDDVPRARGLHQGSAHVGRAHPDRPRLP